MFRAHCLVGLLALLGTKVLFAQSDFPPTVAPASKSTWQSLLGRKPPELLADREHWLAGAPVTLEKCAGRVVWLQFQHSERCVSFRRELLRWESQFQSCGLVVIEVSGGECLDLEESRSRVRNCDIRHPVLWDKDNKNARTFGVRGGSALLIGSAGRVFWQGNPKTLASRVDDENAFRKTLKLELEKAHRHGK